MVPNTLNSRAQSTRCPGHIVSFSGAALPHHVFTLSDTSRLEVLCVEAASVFAQGLVTLFVMIGLGIVFGLPYLVARNRRMRKERGSASAPSALSNILELTRKRGHVN